MKNEELKKKIVEVLKPVIRAGNISCNEENACKKCWFPCEIERTAGRLADALIAAGIGDVKEAEQRALVAEKALQERATYCAMEDLDYFSLTTVAVESRAKELYGGWVRQAEKELAEEMKDG